MEYLRRFMRHLLGYNSSTYRLAASFANFFSVFLAEGFTTVRALNRLQRESGTEHFLKLKSLGHPIMVRAGTEDIGAIVNNVARQEYGQFPPGFLPKRIVDAGAYIGDTSAYFATRFRDAQIVALEPNPESLRVARINLEPYGSRVKLIEKALWTSDGNIFFGGLEMGARIDKGGSTSVPTTSIPTIMRDMAWRDIDLLKMDIEGAEIHVVGGPTSAEWLGSVRMVLLETHGQESESHALSALRGAGFSVTRYRNVWYCSNKSFHLG